jgi:hypothetical protein
MRSTSSGEYFGCDTKAFQALYSSGSHRSVLGHDDVRQAVDQRNVGSGLQLKMVVGFNMRRPNEIDGTRIQDDELCALAQSLLHSRRKYGMPVGRIRADDHDHICLVDRGKFLCAGRRTKRGLQAIAGWRVANPGACIDVVVIEHGANEFLHHESFFVRAT